MKPLARLHPLPRSTLWDGAYASLRAALLEGRLAPGQRIVLRDIAEQLGISLTPVRDAVNRLIAERVLERGSVGQGGGATVPMLGADQFRQLMTIRSSLEPAAAAAALPHATPEALDAIELSLQAMKRGVDEHQLDRYLAEHYRFHFGIYALCRMPIVLEVIESAWLRCAPTLTLALPQYIPGLRRYPFHIAVLQGLRDGNADAVARGIRDDIDSARDDICALLERAGRL